MAKKAKSVQAPPPEAKQPPLPTWPRRDGSSALHPSSRVEPPRPLPRWTTRPLAIQWRDFERRKRIGAGVLRGLQIRWEPGEPGFGGFDSHTLPPFPPRCRRFRRPGVKPDLA